MIKNHLLRKNTCVVTLEDIKPDVLLNEFFPLNTQLICQICKKEFLKAGMLLNHQSICGNAPTTSKIDSNVQPTKIIKNESTCSQKVIADLQTEMANLKQELAFIKSLLVVKLESPVTPASTITTNVTLISDFYNGSAPANSLNKPDTSYEDTVTLIKNIKAVRSVEDVCEIINYRCKHIYFNNQHPENHCIRFFKENTYSFSPLFTSWQKITPKEATKLVYEQTANAIFSMIEDLPIILSCDAQDIWEHSEELYDDHTTTINRKCNTYLLNSVIIPLQNDSKYAAHSMYLNTV
jgi:hypothetical protein